MDWSWILGNLYPKRLLPQDSQKRVFRKSDDEAGSAGGKASRRVRDTSAARYNPCSKAPSDSDKKKSGGWIWGEQSEETLAKFIIDSKPGKPGLKEMCKQLDLPRSGSKQDFIKRLLDYQAQAKAAAAPPTVSLPEAGDRAVRGEEAPPPVSLPEAGDGAVQGEADASVPAVQAEALAPVAPQPLADPEAANIVAKICSLNGI